MKNDGPCRECQDRYIGCFADCDVYKAWKAARVEENRKIAAARNREARLTYYAVEMSRKQKRRTRRK